MYLCCSQISEKRVFLFSGGNNIMKRNFERNDDDKPERKRPALAR